MRRTLTVVLIAIPTGILIGSCGPSPVQDRQEEVREQRRIDADEAVAEIRLEERRRENMDAASAAFHEWFLHTMREPDHEPRTYENSLTHVSLQGETLVVGLSVADPQAAVELCQLTLDGWSDRTKHGVLEIQVVSSDDGSTLAQSVYLATGAQVCE